MRRAITERWLRKQYACPEGIDWFLGQNERNGIALIRLLMEEHYDWANWLIVRLMTRRQTVQYAVYAARQVLDIFEVKYPNDNRPRLAIEAAERCITRDTAKNRAAAGDAARAAAGAAARAAAWAAAGDAARAAAWAAAWAAEGAAAGAAARAAAWAAAGDAARDATMAAEGAAAMFRNIIEYGVGLLEGKECEECEGQ